jgi:hypothetical protein
MSARADSPEEFARKYGRLLTERNLPGVITAIPIDHENDATRRRTIVILCMLGMIDGYWAGAVVIERLSK